MQKTIASSIYLISSD